VPDIGDRRIVDNGLACTALRITAHSHLWASPQRPEPPAPRLRRLFKLGLSWRLVPRANAAVGALVPKSMQLTKYAPDVACATNNRASAKAFGRKS
jgi:hypothetical protein